MCAIDVRPGDESNDNPRIAQIIRIWGSDQGYGHPGCSRDEALAALKQPTRQDMTELMVLLHRHEECLRIAAIRCLANIHNGQSSHNPRHENKLNVPWGDSDATTLETRHFNTVGGEADLEIEVDSLTPLIATEMALRGALYDNYIVAREAAKALQQFGCTLAGTTSALLERAQALQKTGQNCGPSVWPVSVESARALVTHDPNNPVLPDMLNKWLWDDFVVVRSNAATLLGDLARNAPSCVPALVRALSDDATSVRGNAAISLGRFGKTAFSAAPQMRKILEHEIRLARGNAILSSYQDVRATLSTLLETGGSGTCAALVQIDHQAGQEARTCLTTEIDGIQTRIATQLQQIPATSREITDVADSLWLNGSFQDHMSASPEIQHILQHSPGLELFAESIDLLRFVADNRQAEEVERDVSFSPVQRVFAICNHLTNLTNYLAKNEIQRVAAEAVAAAAQNAKDAAAWTFQNPECAFPNPISPFWDPLAHWWRRSEMRLPWYHEPVGQLLLGAELFCRAGSSRTA